MPGARHILLAFLLVPLAGCADAAPEPEPAARPDVGRVQVHALYWNDCPPNSTCAPVGGGAGHAEVLLDGVVANVTDMWGDASLADVAPGDHRLCVRHKDLGADERLLHVAAGGDERVELMLRRSHPPCS